MSPSLSGSISLEKIAIHSWPRKPVCRAAWTRTACESFWRSASAGEASSPRSTTSEPSPTAFLWTRIKSLGRPAAWTWASGSGSSRVKRRVTPSRTTWISPGSRRRPKRPPLSPRAQSGRSPRHSRPSPLLPITWSRFPPTPLPRRIRRRYSSRPTRWLAPMTSGSPRWALASTIPTKR